MPGMLDQTSVRTGVEIRSQRRLSIAWLEYLVSRVQSGSTAIASLLAAPHQLWQNTRRRKHSIAQKRTMFRANLGKLCFEGLEDRRLLAAISITGSGSYSQNFNSLITTGSATWTDNSTIAGWYSQRTGNGTTYAADTGSGNGGGLYSYGTGTNADRALGTIGSNNSAAGHFAHGVQFQNTSAASVTLGTVSYVGEQWRNGNNTTANIITFWYRISTTPIILLNPNVNTGWTAVTSLNFTSPINTSTAGPLDGNLAANRSLISSSLNLTLPSNSYIMLRWSDPDHTGTDHGLAIDDFSISYTAAAIPTITGAAAASAFNTTYGTASAAQTFAVSGSNLTANLVATAPTGFEVSSNGTTFGQTATFTQSGGTASGTLSIRLAANAPVLGTYNAQNIVLSSTDATSVNIATAASGNVVSAAPLTIKANDVTKVQGTTLTSDVGSTAFTPTGLVLSQTVGSVTITYGAGAAAGDPAGTYTGSVTPSAATGGTFTASNYSITYLPGDIIVSASPTITPLGTLSPLSTTYGTASAPTSFSVSGGFLTGDLTVTAPTGFEISTNATNGYSSSLVLAQSSGTVASTTIFVRLPATQAAGNYSGNITITGGGASDATVAIPSSTVSKKALTIVGVTADNKVYDGTVAATVTGTAVFSGLENGDDFSVGSLAWVFSTKGAGPNKTVSVLGPINPPSDNYTITPPSLTGSISQLAITVTGAVASDKAFNNSTAATITGATLVGVISPDVVLVSGGGTFADVNVGTDKPVTAALVLGGADAANYSLTQPTGLTASITQASQTITFGALAPVTTATATVTLPLNSSAGLPISYESSNTSVATVSGNILTILSAGSTVIKASQAGNGNISAALPVEQTQLVTLAPVVLARFEFPATNSLVPSVSGSNLTVSSVSLSAGTIETNITTGTYFPNEPYIEETGGWIANNQSSAKNFFFTITPSPGFSIDISNISFNAYATSAGPTAFGFAVGTTNVFSVNAPDSSLVSVNQPVVGQTDLTGTITIRIQGWLNGSRTSVGSGAFRLDDILVSGFVKALPVASPELTISNPLVDNTKVYDGLAYSANATVANGNGQTPLPSFTYYVGAGTSGTNLGSTPPINVGTYTVVASTAANITNNAAVSQPYTYSITPAALTVTADAKAKIFGTVDPPLTFSASGFVSSENAATALTGALQRVSGEPVGTYAINQGSLSAVNGNYDITFVPGVFTINPVPIVPAFTSASLNGGGVQRSQLTSLMISFNDSVTLLDGALSLQRLGPGGGSVGFVVNPSVAAGSFVLTFTSGFANGSVSLADGNYQLTVDESKLLSSTGTAGVGVKAFGSVAADKFFRLYGDADGDGDVDAVDSRAFRNALTVYNSAFDWDGNNSVTNGSVDSTNFSANLNKKRASLPLSN